MADAVNKAFDVFFSVDTWHKRHAYDVARFYGAMLALHQAGQGTACAETMMKLLVGELRSRKPNETGAYFQERIADYAIRGAGVCEYLSLMQAGRVRSPEEESPDDQEGEDDADRKGLPSHFPVPPPLHPEYPDES